MKKELIILSLGGSVIIPDEVDSKFLKEFSKVIKKYSSKYKFIIVTGGGKTARKYIKGLEGITKDNSAKDWMGISATAINALLLRIILNAPITNNPTKKEKFGNILIGHGWKPGFSTDYIAVKLAQTYKAKTVINMTNVKQLYDKDPNKYSTAKKIDSIDWKKFKKIVGSKWKPGMNTPFDPIATKLAAKLKLELILIGKDMNNFSKFLSKKKYLGSKISQ